jgi:hypothetical protein
MLDPILQTAPLSIGLHGLTRLWDRRAAEAADGAAAEAYQRAAAEALEVLRALAASPPRAEPEPAAEQQDLGL